MQKFRDKMDKFHHVFCPICKECYPSMVLVQGECRRCNAEKKPNKFSVSNNMDPGDVPNELQGLTEIEEMLIRVPHGSDRIGFRSNPNPI